MHAAYNVREAAQSRERAAGKRAARALHHVHWVGKHAQWERALTGFIFGFGVGSMVTPKLCAAA